MYIDVRIPYDEKNRLARAYNLALADGISEWVLFLDHDVFLCNPRWYNMCVAAVTELTARDPEAACVGCVCGGERHHRTMEQHGSPNCKIDYHINRSKLLYQKHGLKLERVREYIPGFFMLLKREVARKVGFVQVNDSINNIDASFGERLLAAGHHIYRMPGLYVYHRRGMKHLKKEFVR